MENNKEKFSGVLYIEPCAGLGNRLAALVSAKYWADQYNRELRIVWKHEQPCAVKYDSIFEKSSDVIIKEINQMGKKQLHLISFVYANIWLEHTRKKCKFITCEEIGQLYRTEGKSGVDKLISSNKILYIKANGFFADEDDLKVGGYFNIPFRKSLIDDAINVMNVSGDVIGVHIRRTDHHDSINNSPTELFERYMDNELTNNQNVFFYLATDDEDERKRLYKKYKLIQRDTYSKNISRVSDEGMMDAVVDMICLSKCKEIYGSYGSTFSMWAARIGDIPISFISKK